MEKMKVLLDLPFKNSNKKYIHGKQCPFYNLDIFIYVSMWPRKEKIHSFSFLKIFVYLSVLGQLWHVGSSSLIRDQARAPYFESAESQPLEHQRSPRSIAFLYHFYVTLNSDFPEIDIYCNQTLLFQELKGYIKKKKVSSIATNFFLQPKYKSTG